MKSYEPHTIEDSQEDDSFRKWMPGQGTLGVMGQEIALYQPIFQ